MTRYYFLLLIVIFLTISCSRTNRKRNEQAIQQRVYNYMTIPENAPDVFDFNPASYSDLDSFENNSDTAFYLQLDYTGMNVANREVKRKAEVYFSKNYEVLGYKDIHYYNPLDKDSLKQEYRDFKD